MNKRKLMLVAMALCMVAILAAGGTLAYFMDTEGVTNTFTIGHIDIEIVEDFGNDTEEGKDTELMPNKPIKKEVDVKNTGANPAYVRVHVAIPQVLDDGATTFLAYENVLHWNMSKASMADGLWNWNATNVNNSAYPDYPGYPGNGGAWNFYTAEIGGIWYNIYVATYETALEPDATTADHAIHTVYLDALLTQQEWDKIQETLGYDNVKVLVAAEGVQVDTFTDAYTALNTAFGVPGTYTIEDWTDNPYKPNAVPAEAAGVVTE